MMKIRFHTLFLIVAFVFATGAFAQSEDRADNLYRDTLVKVDSPPAQFYDQLTVDQILIQDSIEASKLNLVPFRSSVIRVARAFYLPPSLLAAFCDVESDWKTWSRRTEPHYKNKAVVKNGARITSKQHGGIPTYYTELDDRSASYGLMQTMGQLAREQGFAGQYLSELHIPDSSLKQGAILLKALLKRYQGDSLSMISAYNQGNNRKVNGAFENARYVYKLNIKWNRYKRLFNDRQLLIGATIDTSVPSYSADHGNNDWFWDRVRSQTAIEARIARNNEIHQDSIVREAETRHSDSSRYAEALPVYSGDGEPPVSLRPVASTSEAQSNGNWLVAAVIIIGCIAALVVLGFNDREPRLTSSGSGLGPDLSHDRSTSGQGSFSGVTSAGRTPVRSSTPLRG